MPGLFAETYPYIARWVKEYGSVGIGYDAASDSFVRIIEQGGEMWRGEVQYDSLDAALQDLEKAAGELMGESLDEE